MENYRDIPDSSHKSHAKREPADCKRGGIGPARAEQIPRQVGLFRMRKEGRKEGSVALVPSECSARRKRVLVRLFGAAYGRRIEWWKFDVGKLFAMKFSGADSATRPVVSGPNNLEQLQLLVRHALLPRFKRFDRNNFATLHLRPRVEAAPDLGNIFDQSAFGEEMAYSINTRDFNRNAYRETIFSSFAAIDCDRLCVLVLLQ
jgi:hypothetical protein